MTTVVNERESATTTPAGRSLSDYRAWLVDLDGTLYRATGVRLAMAMELALSGWRDARVVQAFRREHERMRDSVGDIFTFEGDRESDAHCASAFDRQLRRTAERLAVPVDAVRAVIERWMIARPGKWIRLFRRKALLSSIAEHRAGGGRTALVSDYPARRKLASLAASELFEVVIANGEGDTAFALKPHPAAYLAAAERLAAPPDECVVIGDRFDADGLAARAAGMAFCHIKDMRVLPPT